MVHGPIAPGVAAFYIYLLIKNGTAQIIEDNRRDGSGQCCFDLAVTGGDTQVKFGFLQDGEFIEETELDQIDFEREYQLRLIGDIVLGL